MAEPQTLPATVTAAPAMMVRLTDQNAPQPTLRRTLRQRLAGRWIWLLLVMLLGGSLGAVLGYLSTHPVYESRALVVFEPVWPQAGESDRIARAAERNMVSLQAQWMAGPQVVDDQLIAQVWATVNRPVLPVTGESFLSRLVIAPRDDQPDQLQVSFRDGNPRLAAKAVSAVVAGHAPFFAQSPWAKRADLIARVHEQIDKTRDLQGKIQDSLVNAKAVFAPQGIDTLLEQNQTELRQVREKLDDANQALAAVHAKQAAMARFDPASDQAIEPLAQHDPQLAAMMLHRVDLRQRLEPMARRMGENAPALKALRQELDDVNEQIDLRVRLTAGMVEESQNESASPDSPAALAPSAEELATTIAALSRRQVDLISEQDRLMQGRLTLDRLGREHDQLEADLDRMNAQLAGMARQGQIGGVMSVLAPAGVPIAPVEDQRPLRAIVLGGLGVVLGAALVLLFALLDDRMSRPTSTELSLPNTAMLGTVPARSAKRDDPTWREQTSLSIHEIRAMLEIRARADGARAFAVTSASHGSGKTSLTVGLASSLAMSGSRVLLVDAQLAGRHAFATPTTGSAASDSTHNDASPLEPAAQSVDQVMVDMGYLDEHQCQLLAMADATDAGLVGMLQGRSLSQSVLPTSIPGLSVLPVQNAGPEHLGLFSGRFVQRIIDESVRDYDLVLFDTGIIPGCVEALYVAAQVDGVILVASRGERQAQFNRSVSYLKMVNAKLAGTVFNRAANRDLGVRVNADASQRGKPAGQVIRGSSSGSGILAAAVQASASPASSSPNAARHEESLMVDMGKPSVRSSRAPQPQRPATLADVGGIAGILDEDDDNAHGAFEASSRPAGPSPQNRSYPDSNKLLDITINDKVNDAIAAARQRRKPSAPRREDRSDQTDDNDANQGA